MKHELDIDVEKFAQDVQIIRHRLDRIEKQIQQALLKREVQSIEDTITRDEASNNYIG